MTSLSNADFANPAGDGTLLFPFVAADAQLAADLPHERPQVATQLARSSVAGGYTMTGFVKAYEAFTGTTTLRQSPPMGLLRPEDVPITSFLAREFGVCDRWFSALPASTQPNRLMAMSGYSLHDMTQASLLPDQQTVFDWLDQSSVRWRVYAAGISFFALMPKNWPHILTDRFRSLEHLAEDARNEADATWPQVIFVEPDYADSPVHLSGHASDNHPPTPVAAGEAFLRDVYQALTSSARRWARTVMILTYDEHGGFHDHVAPLPVPFAPPPGASFSQPFDSTGPRVPAVVVSPWVEQRRAQHAPLDHTSILQLLADRFAADGEAYSPEAAARRAAGIRSVREVLNASTARADIPAAPEAPALPGVAPAPVGPPSANQQSLISAVKAFHQAHGSPVVAKFPGLAPWLAKSAPLP